MLDNKDKVRLTANKTEINGMVYHCNRNYSHEFGNHFSSQRFSESELIYFLQDRFTKGIFYTPIDSIVIATRPTLIQEADDKNDNVKILQQFTDSRKLMKKVRTLFRP